LERALELTQTALGPEDTAVGELAYRLAQRYADAGDYDRALRLFQQSVAIICLSGCFSRPLAVV